MTLVSGMDEAFRVFNAIFAPQLSVAWNWQEDCHPMPVDVTTVAYELGKSGRDAAIAAAKKGIADNLRWYDRQGAYADMCQIVDALAVELNRPWPPTRQRDIDLGRGDHIFCIDE